MSVGALWQKLTGREPTMEAAAKLATLREARSAAERRLAEGRDQAAGLRDQVAELQLAGILDPGEPGGADERTALLARLRAVEEEVALAELLVPKLDAAIAQADAAAAQEAFAAEQEAVRALVSDYQQVGEEVLARAEDLATLVARLGRLRAEMEPRYTALGSRTRELGISGMGVEWPDQEFVRIALSRLREAHSEGLRQGERAADVTPTAHVPPVSPVEAPVTPLARVLAAPLASAPTGSRYVEHGHIWELRPGGEGTCTHGDGACGKAAAFDATYTMPSGKTRSWRFCEAHGAQYARNHHLAVPVSEPAIV